MKENFKESIDVGAIGERIVWDELSHRSERRTIVDVRNDKKHFRDLDVDFLFEVTDGSFYWIEVKTDLQAHGTRNMAYEISTSGNIGCFEKTKADIIFYYIYESNELYWCMTNKLRNYVKTNSSNFRVVKMGDASEGYLIPIDELLKQKIFREWKRESKYR